jgi:hypothetical protein
MEKTNTRFLQSIEGKIYNILSFHNLFLVYGSFLRIENNQVGNIAILSFDFSFNLKMTKELNGGANGPIHYIVWERNHYLIFGIFNSWAGKTAHNLAILDQSFHLV